MEASNGFTIMIRVKILKKIIYLNNLSKALKFLYLLEYIFPTNFRGIDIWTDIVDFLTWYNSSSDTSHMTLRTKQVETEWHEQTNHVGIWPRQAEHVNIVSNLRK